MSDQQLQDSQPAPHSSSLILKVSSVLILAVLIGIAGLLYSLNRKLDTVGRATPPPVAPPAAKITLPQPTVQSDAPAPVPQRFAANFAAKSKDNGKLSKSVSETGPAGPPPNRVVASAATTPAVAPVPVAANTPVDYPPPFPPTQAATVPVAPRKITASLPQGSILTIRLIQSLNSDTNHAGDYFSASLDEPIFSNGIVAVPVGATVQGRVVNSQQAGRVSGLSELSVQLESLQLPGGESVNLATETITRQGESTLKQDAAKVGVGAAIGAAIGALGGGRKGAGIGAATGAGAGTAGVLLTRGKPVALGPETRLSFSLAAPVEFQVTANPQSATSAASGQGRVALPYPAPPNSNDPFAGQRPRLHRKML